MEQILEVTQGLPGCGKTTYAIEKCKADPKWKRINRDELRAMKGVYDMKDEDLVTSWERNCVISALRAGYNVIIDATNLNPKYLPQWKEIADTVNESSDREVKVQYKIFTNVSVEECIKRDSVRALKGGRSVGEKVIRDFAKRYLTCDSNYATIIQNPTLPHAIIVDLDGTVALCGDRGHYDYAKVQFDLVHDPIANIVRHYIKLGDMKVIYISGREDSCLGVTQDWLTKHALWGDNVVGLYMRKAGDFRKDCIVKKELFDLNILDKYYIEFCLDDRNQVVDMWRSLGLVVLQVCDREKGNF